MDTIWWHPFSAIVSACSQAGKSELVRRIVENRREMISPVPKRVYWCYGSVRPTYQSLINDPEVVFVNGFPDLSSLKDCLVIFDDYMMESKNSPYINSLATKGCHHLGISCIQILQNAFYGGRTARINSQYMILVKNPSDQLQAATLARQLFPKNSKYFLEAYEDATRNPHGYLCK